MFLSSFKIARGIPGSPLPVPMSKIFLFCFKCFVKAIASSIASPMILSVFFFEIRLCLVLNLIVSSLKSFILSHLMGKLQHCRDAVARHGPVDPHIYGTARPGKSGHGKSWHGTARKILTRKRT